MMQLHTFSPRQQLLGVSVIVLAGVVLAGALVLKPVHDWRSTMQSEQQQLQNELSLVRNLARELEKLRETVPERSDPGLSLTALVDQSLQGRPFQPTRIQMNEAGQMQLRFESLAFEDALSWLQELEAYPGVLATSVNVARDQNGRVSLGLTLQRL